MPCLAGVFAEGGAGAHDGSLAGGGGLDGNAASPPPRPPNPIHSPLQGMRGMGFACWEARVAPLPSLAGVFAEGGAGLAR